MQVSTAVSLFLVTNAVCLLLGWLAAPRFASDGPAVAAGSWASNGISESSSGNLFGIVKVRSYRGPRLYAEWHADAHAPARPTQPHGGSGRLCKNWAVTTSIFAPTVTVRQLAALPNWCLVVAGDKKGPKAHEYNVSGVIYLTPADQERLPYAAARHLRWNHFGRKNLGFLYAVAHGASWVYDTDDDNELQRPHGAPPFPAAAGLALT